MSLFVRVNVGFWDHRKTLRLRGLIGDAALWIPPRLWSYAANNQPDGDFEKYLPGEIAMLVGYNGDAQAMLQALQSTGFMDGMRIHEWEEHNGYHSTFAERAKTAAAARWSKKKAPKRTTGKREEKKGEEKRQALLAHAISIATSIPWAMGEVVTLKFKEWIDYRIHGTAPKDGSWEALFGRQIKMLSEYSSETACEIIESSLRNGYTGLFPPKGLGAQPPKTEPTPTGAYDAPSLI